MLISYINNWSDYKKKKKLFANYYLTGIVT